MVMRDYRWKYAKAMGDAEHEFPVKPLDLYKIESKPIVLFQAASICKSEGNERLKKNNPGGALDKYDEGLYIIDKCYEVLLTWRLIFRQIHNEKAEKDQKDKGLKQSALVEQPMPDEFRGDQKEEQTLRLTLLLNAAQAALSMGKFDIVEARASQVLELDPYNIKALYRRGVGRVGAGQNVGAIADFWSMLKASDFESKEALTQLMKLMPKDDVQRKLKQMKEQSEKKAKLGKIITEMDADERIAIQDERYQRYQCDCEQRKLDGQRRVCFDDWAKQYEWRYDADERNKARQMWPEIFNHMGPAPLPVEDWEVDYLTHKEIDKIVYHRQTAAMAAKKRELEGSRKEQEAIKEGFVCELEIDDEDEEVLQEEEIKKGYNYWW